MGMSKKLNVIRFYTILAVLAMCLSNVEDLVTKNSSDWICNTESGNIDSKELEQKISQGELIKLEITYKLSVDPTCGSANDTLDLNNKTEDAELLTGFGDLLLILLNIDHEIAPYLPNHYLTSSVFTKIINAHAGLIFLTVFSLVCYTVRYLFVYGINSEYCIWKSCFVHSGHSFALYSLKCLFCPCDECKNSPSNCPKQIEVPDNILHNLEELPGIFIKYWSFVFRCFGELLLKINLPVDIILMVLVIAIMILAICWLYLLLVLSLFFFLLLLVFPPLVDILLSSPLVCLCHGRMRAFKDKRLWFKFLEFLLIVFSLIWLAFYSVRGVVVVEIASAGFLHMLNGHPKKLLESVAVVVIACHYVFSSYSYLTAQYLELVRELFNSYRKKVQRVGGNRKSE